MQPSSKPKLLLNNPPGKRVYLRDYFCSKVSQADYLNHPIDFVYLSGLLREHFDLHLLDAIVDRLSIQKSLQHIQTLQPDVIIGLIGSVSYEEDVAFYRALAAQTQATLLLIGDVLIESREARLREFDFAAAFLHDFSDASVLAFLQGKREGLTNMTLRVGEEIHAAPLVRARHESFELPLPLHQLFMNKDYRYPFVRRRRFATVMTEFGCPYRCTFCIMSTLGWKIRPAHNVLAELDSVHALGIRELFFLDQTFALQKPRALELLAAMRTRKYDFGWLCFTRPDILEDEVLGEMKKAGCHTLILGLESGDDAILAV
ncbi:MAG: radical SAM protein, partial [candidate division KSB1 bacterium]